MNGVSFTAVRMPMGWGHVAGQLSSKFTSRSATGDANVGWNGEGGEWRVLRIGGGARRCWEKDVDSRERWLVRCGGVLLCGGAIVRGLLCYSIAPMLWS